MSYFQNFVGNKAVVNMLEQDISSKNISQAYLFCGPAHIGKRTLAKQFVLTLLAAGKDEAQAKVIEHELGKMMHSDVIVLDELYQHEVQTDWDQLSNFSNAPQDHRKRNKTKSDTISIDDIRALQDILYETPSGTYKVCIITKVNRLNTAASNALLKILEEPPAHLIFLLTAERCNELLPTITSRCRIIQCTPATNAEISQALGQVDEDTRQFILHVCQGAPGKALTLIHDSDALLKAKTLHSAAKQFWQSNSKKEQLSSIKPLLGTDAEAEVFLQHLALALRELQLPLHETEAFIELSKSLNTNAYRPLLVHNWLLKRSEIAKK